MHLTALETVKNTSKLPYYLLKTTLIQNHLKKLEKMIKTFFLKHYFLLFRCAWIRKLWSKTFAAAFLVQNTGLFSCWLCLKIHSKNKVRNAENNRLMTTFDYFSLRHSKRVKTKNCEDTRMKLLNKIRGKALKKICYAKICFIK